MVIDELFASGSIRYSTVVTDGQFRGNISDVEGAAVVVPRVSQYRVVRDEIIIATLETGGGGGGCVFNGRCGGYGDRRGGY